MYFSCKFLVCIIIGVGNLLSIFVESRFLTQHRRKLFLGKFPIPRRTPDPININSKKVHKVVSSPFSLYAKLDDKVRVVNNGKSVEVILDQSSTEFSVTGGVLQKDKYQFHKVKYLYANNSNGVSGTTIDGKGFPLENTAIFFNKKYGSFENALLHRDGLAEVDFLIGICSGPNELFDEYGEKLKQVQEPGSSVQTTFGSVIKWFAGSVPLTNPYYGYPGSYVDDTTGGRYYCTTVLILPHSPEMCLSKEQFAETFGSFKNSAGQPLTNKERRFLRRMPVVQTKGIVNTATP